MVLSFASFCINAGATYVKMESVFELHLFVKLSATFTIAITWIVIAWIAICLLLAILPRSANIPIRFTTSTSAAVITATKYREYNSKHNIQPP